MQFLQFSVFSKISLYPLQKNNPPHNTAPLGHSMVGYQVGVKLKVLNYFKCLPLIQLDQMRKSRELENLIFFNLESYGIFSDFL